MDINNEDQAKNQQGEAIEKPINFIMPDRNAARFSNYALIQHDEEYFTLSFFEIQKPPLIGTPEEKREALEKLESIPAVCVARVIVGPKHFKRLISAMQKNLEGFEKEAKL